MQPSAREAGLLKTVTNLIMMMMMVTYACANADYLLCHVTSHNCHVDGLRLAGTGRQCLALTEVRVRVRYTARYGRRFLDLTDASRQKRGVCVCCV